MKKFILLIAAVVIIPLFGVNSARAAETKTLSASADSYVYNNISDVGIYENFGSGTSLVVGNNAQGWATNTSADTVIKFDLSTVPSGSTISSAKMKLYLFSCGFVEGVANIYGKRILSNWTESTVNGAVAQNMATTNEGMIQITNSPCTAGWHEFNILDITKAWITSGKTNYGIKLINQDTVTYIREFYSREASSNKPQLVVTYTAPASASNPAGSSTGTGSTGGSSSTGTSSSGQAGSTPGVDGSSVEGADATATAIADGSAVGSTDTTTSGSGWRKYISNLWDNTLGRFIIIVGLLVLLGILGAGVFVTIMLIKKRKKVTPPPVAESVPKEKAPVKEEPKKEEKETR